MDEATEALLLGAKVDQARLMGRQTRAFYDELTDAPLSMSGAICLTETWMGALYEIEEVEDEDGE